MPPWLLWLCAFPIELTHLSEGLRDTGLLAVQKPVFQYDSYFPENFTGETKLVLGNSQGCFVDVCREDVQGRYISQWEIYSWCFPVPIHPFTASFQSVTS